MVKDMKKKLERNARIRKYNLLFTLGIIIVDTISIIILSIIMPQVQNFPPYSNDSEFQHLVQPLSHFEEYALILFFGGIVHLLAYKIVIKNISKFNHNYIYEIEMPHEFIKQVRKDTINIPYQMMIIEWILFIGGGIILNFIMLVDKMAIIKFTMMIIAVVAMISLFSFIVTQIYLKEISLLTYEVDSQYEKNNGIRISTRNSLVIQALPFILVMLIVPILMGYSQTISAEGNGYANYYKVYMANIPSTNEINEDTLKTELDKIPLCNKTDYYFIIRPDNSVYCSIKDGYVSDFVLTYRDVNFKKTGGMLYERFGNTDELYAKKFVDVNGNTWYFGYKFKVENQKLLLQYIFTILVILAAAVVLLIIWARNISKNTDRISENLKKILESDEISRTNELPIITNDELSDLSYYYNKIQERMLSQQNTLEEQQDTIKKNQDILIERERLATLGQMIGGIAHNLKTPIMSISGAMEGLDDLIKEYDESIDDPEVTKEDHHAIAHDMSDWVTKVKSYDSYMSEIITAVKGQAVSFNDSSAEKFEISELLNRVNILMKHELKEALLTLNVDCRIDQDTELTGNVNALVQVVNNLVQNAIQAYNGEPNKSIDLIIDQNVDDIFIIVKDYGSGIPEDVQQKLFKSMVTTKGHKGSGLGLFMSYSTIKGNFHGNLTFESKVGEGTTFTIRIPKK